MRTLNRTAILGTVIKKPSVQTTSTGKTVANMQVDVKDTFSSGKSFTTAFKVSAWDPQIIGICAGLEEGATVHVEGRIGQEDPYQGKDGKWRKGALTLVADYLIGVATSSYAEPASLPPQVAAPSALNDIPF
jgi:single-stranded DNA-binding protein